MHQRAGAAPPPGSPAFERSHRAAAPGTDKTAPSSCSFSSPGVGRSPAAAVVPEPVAARSEGFYRAVIGAIHPARLTRAG